MVTVNIVTSGVHTAATSAFHTEVSMAWMPSQTGSRSVCQSAVAAAGMVTVNIVTSGVQTVATRPFHTEVRVAEIPDQVVCTPVSSAAFACGTTTVNSATSGAMTVSRIQANAVPIAPVIAA